MPKERVNPYGVFNFRVQFDDFAEGAFSEITGLDTEQGVIEYRTGDEDTVMRQIPGLRKHPRVVMKRGLIASPKLFEWRKKVMDGIGNADDSEGKTQVTIHLLDEKRQPVFTWILRKAWPVKWAGPALAAGKNEASVEVMELVHEELKIE